MKIDRLLAITMLLVNRNRVSAAELADHFEVNIRTIYRDIDSLNRAGIPVISYQGANGGYGIIENYKVDKNVLTADEISSIITALKSISTTIDDRKIVDTLEKIKGLIPGSELEKLKQKSEQVIIDFDPWGVNKRDKEKFSIIKVAINGSNLIEFFYTNAKGESENRLVEPSALIFMMNAWYLRGFCRIRNDFRVFKLSRIKNLDISAHTFSPRQEIPDSLPWRPESQHNRNFIELVLKFSPAARARVEDFFDTEQIEYLSDGNIVVNVIYPEDEWVYGTILSYGENVEVLAPDHLRSIIKEKARAIYEKYCNRTD